MTGETRPPTAICGGRATRLWGNGFVQAGSAVSAALVEMGRGKGGRPS